MRNRPAKEEAAPEMRGAQNDPIVVREPNKPHCSPLMKCVNGCF
jgi:hypothetical protein